MAKKKSAKKENIRVGVFLCNCGHIISDAVDMLELKKYARSLPRVVYVGETGSACREDFVPFIQDAARRAKFNRIVMASCACCTLGHICYSCSHQKIKCKENVLQGSGINKYAIHHINLLEHVALVHSDKKSQSTEKTKALLRMGVARAIIVKPQPDTLIPVEPKAVVLGANISGMTIALHLAIQGYAASILENEEGPAQGKITATETKIIKNLAEQIKAHPKINLLRGYSLQSLEGTVGKFQVRIQKNEDTMDLKAGALVLPADAFQVDGKPVAPKSPPGKLLPLDVLAAQLSRGILPPSPQVERRGVYLCGNGVTGSASARIEEALGVAQQVEGLLASKEIGIEATTAQVNEKICIFCGSCAEVCPYGAISPKQAEKEKWVMQVNEALCTGCGTCGAVCPPLAISSQYYSDNQILAQIRTAFEGGLKPQTGEPNIMVFVCNWCSYTALDLAGVHGHQYPPNTRVIRLMCSAKVDPLYIMEAFRSGAQGVLVSSCKIGDCHYLNANKYTVDRIQAVQGMLKEFGMEPKRLQLCMLDSYSSGEFAKAVKKMAKSLENMGTESLNKWQEAAAKGMTSEISPP